MNQQWNCDEIFTEAVMKHVHFVVGQTMEQGEYSPSDREDLEQEMILKLLEGRRHFDPQRAQWVTFAARIVEAHACDLLRRRSAEKRDDREVDSLHEMVLIDEGELVEMIQTIGHESRAAHRGYVSRTEEELHQLHLDLEEVLEALPADLCHLAQQLKQSSLAQIAREMGVTRGTLRGQLKRLRQYFHREDFQQYL